MAYWKSAFRTLVPKAGSDPANPTFGGVVRVDEQSAIFLGLCTKLPYLVPVGKKLRLTDVQFSSKAIVQRSSYLILYDGRDNLPDAARELISVPEHAPCLNIKGYYDLPAGTLFSAVFTNNSPEDQWMAGFIIGSLVTA